MKYIVIICVWGVSAFAAFDARQEVIKLMEQAGMENLLAAPVRVTATLSGPLVILDEGIFVVQHSILNVSGASEPNVIIVDPAAIPLGADKLVIVTHGWLDKGQDRWPAEMAAALYARIDPNQWICGSFDWKGGSAVLTSIQAAEYARDIAGPRLAAAVIKLNRPWKHIHLIGHSAGAWAIQSAARQLAQVCPDAVFHLTFLDAYVPARWDLADLGRLFDDLARQRAFCWAEHYYTRDITLDVTQCKLKWAHNVDISALDPFIREHEFPYRWYMATITGFYSRWDEKKLLVQRLCGTTEYGFTRSLEFSPENWNQSFHLMCNTDVVFKKPE